MSVIIDRRNPLNLNISDCPNVSENDEYCLWRNRTSEAGYHKFEPYETQTELLIVKLDELIKLLEDWNNNAV